MFSSFFFSCNPKHKQVDYVFKIVLEVRVMNDDKFQLFYTEQNQTKFNDKNILKVNVKGFNEYQTIVFELPKKTFPNKLRIDVGENKMESPIEIKSCQLIWGENVLEMDHLSFNRFFKPNVYIIVQGRGDIYERRVMDNKYDPFFASTAFLEQYLKLKF